MVIKGCPLVATIYTLRIVVGWCCCLPMSTLGKDLVANIKEKKDALGSGSLMMIMYHVEYSRIQRSSNIEASEIS